jgi:vacuolar-type H+-ATPase subunit E/Vma4
MTVLSRRSETALAPVRAALLRAARQEAADIRRDADEHASALMEMARREAERIRLAALEEGTATARTEAALRSARVRRQAHEVVLRRRSILRRDLQRQVRARAVELRNDPRYPALLARLTEQSHALLGWEATVAESPQGGVIAEAGSRRLDLSLPALATRTLESMTQEVRALWTG